MTNEAFTTENPASTEILKEILSMFSVRKAAVIGLSKVGQ